MPEKKNRLGLDAITRQAIEIANNPEAQKFVRSAGSSSGINPEPPKEKEAPQATSLKKEWKKEKKFIVNGRLKNRQTNCGKASLIYLFNETEDWIKNHSVGSHQAVVNHLIARGIEAIEKEFNKTGAVFVDEELQK